jgi:hypothetical protein
MNRLLRAVPEIKIFDFEYGRFEVHLGMDLRRNVIPVGDCRKSINWRGGRGMC